MMAALDRYHDNLTNFPHTGEGVHSRTMSVATLGILAGLAPEQIHADLWRVIPKDRKNPDREIQDAINKALAEHNGGTYVPRPRPDPIVKDGRATLQKIISQGKISDEVDLWEASPVRLLESP